MCMAWVQVEGVKISVCLIFSLRVTMIVSVHLDSNNGSKIDKQCFVWIADPGSQVMVVQSLTHCFNCILIVQSPF